MSEVKVHILFGFREGPWGGSNQFLRALRDELRVTGHWADFPDLADVILFDSFNSTHEVIRWKRRLTQATFVQRIDGPISRYRGRDQYLDRLVYVLANKIADGVVFQSEFSLQANLTMGMTAPRLKTVILNAPQAIFHRRSSNRTTDCRVRIIVVSWSENRNKGFDVLEYLDHNLDFSRYALTFVGNSPTQFRNVLQLPPQAPEDLSELLPEYDIFLAPSRNDPCSNALAEALAAGLPALGLRSGGHPELMKKC